jgi:hypothetical protein
MSRDTQTLSFNFGEDEADRLKEILRRMGEFIAYFEVAEEKLSLWQRGIEEHIQVQDQAVNAQLEEIRNATHELQNIMTETGVARWRMAAEESLKHGRDHIKVFEKLCEDQLGLIEKRNEDINKQVKKSIDRLDRAATYTVKNISESINSFRLSDFQRLTEQSVEQIEKTSQGTIHRLRDMAKWFQWKNVGLAFAIAIFASVSMGLFVNAELPWETHQQVAMQRNAGQALINAWPSLSKSEQQRIIDNSKKAFI